MRRVRNEDDAHVNAWHSASAARFVLDTIRRDDIGVKGYDARLLEMLVVMRARRRGARSGASTVSAHIMLPPGCTGWRWIV